MHTIELKHTNKLGIYIHKMLTTDMLRNPISNMWWFINTIQNKNSNHKKNNEETMKLKHRSCINWMQMGGAIHNSPSNSSSSCWPSPFLF